MKKLLQLPVEVLISIACGAVLVLGVTAQLVSGAPLVNAASASDQAAPESKAEGTCASDEAAGGCPFAAMKARMTAEDEHGCPSKARRAARAARAARDGAVVPAVEKSEGCDTEGMCPSKAAAAKATAAADSAVVPAVEKSETCDKEGACPMIAAKAVSDGLGGALTPAVEKSDVCDEAGACPMKAEGCCPGEAEPTKQEAAPAEGTKVAQAETPAITE